MIKFSKQDRDRITAAICAAEQDTSGEFVTVVARYSDHYVFLPLLWGAMIALLLPGVFILFSVPLSLLHVYQIQLVLFIVLTALLLFIPGLHMRFVPRRVKHSRASRLAKAQFYQQGVHLTKHHSGVLFFVSLAEHYVEIVADQGIHEKIGDARWQEIIWTFLNHMQRDEVVEGFVAAIAACGAAMSEHYPRDADDVNELSDGLIEL